MKKFIVFAAFLMGIAFFSATDSNAQALAFSMTNNTGFTLNNIYVTPSEQANWGEDILPNDLWENGANVDVTIPATYGETCLFDIKITDLEGNAVTFTGVDACKLISLQINGDGTYNYLQTK